VSAFAVSITGSAERVNGKARGNFESEIMTMAPSYEPCTRGHRFDRLNCERESGSLSSYEFTNCGLTLPDAFR